MHVKKLLFRLLEYYAVMHRRHHYCHRFQQNMRSLGIRNKAVPGESDYIRFWNQLTRHVEPYSFRLYSHFLTWDGKGNIIPEDIGHSYIEPMLNPPQYVGFYADKNLYTQYIKPTEAIAKTLLRRMLGGALLDDHYQPALSFSVDGSAVADYLKGADELVLKPSVNSKGGGGVMFFKRQNGIFTSGETVLDGPFLRQYGSNFVLQEVIDQHPYLAQFNPTSLNSIRVCTYRSILTERIHLAACALRIGKKGARVDNTHAGGGLVIVDPETGCLGHEVFNWEGMVEHVINGIDLQQHSFVIPHWISVCNFAISIASQNHHCRLIAQDLTVDTDGNPRLIECNVKSFSFRIPMLAGKSLFGDETQAVIDYCLRMRG